MTEADLRGDFPPFKGFQLRLSFCSYRINTCKKQKSLRRPNGAKRECAFGLLQALPAKVLTLVNCCLNSFMGSFLSRFYLCFATV